jgi:hypothetical protein
VELALVQVARQALVLEEAVWRRELRVFLRLRWERLVERVFPHYQQSRQVPSLHRPVELALPQVARQALVLEEAVRRRELRALRFEPLPQHRRAV